MRTISAVLGLLGLLAFAWTQGTAFTYQGYLRQGGTPVNANYDFQFSLWNAVSGGSQVGSTQTVTNVPVQNGLFTVTLDFGNVWDGSDRFLQIAVRPAGSGSYTTLAPRVKIDPTPYAVRAGVASPIGAASGDLSGSYPNPTVARLQGRSVAATAPSNGQVLKWDGSAWAPAADAVGGLTLPFSGSAGVAGAAFSITNTAANGAAYGVWGQSDSHDEGTGVLGWATAASGFTNGVYGVSASTSGRGVFGWATATTGVSFGGYFVSSSSSGRGVYGFAAATTGDTYGVYGQSDSSSGRGVYGLATATSGFTYGGYFASRSPDGIGVFGVASATSGTNYGAYFVSNGASGTGVYGMASAASGATYGGYFVSNGASGTGVYGFAAATTGTTYGGYFENRSPDGRGVYGFAAATTGTTYGGYFENRSPDGRGVYGLATATIGTNYGGFFTSNSSSGVACMAMRALPAASPTAYSEKPEAPPTGALVCMVSPLLPAAILGASMESVRAPSARASSA